jgi:hypothetical protein
MMHSIKRQSCFKLPDSSPFIIHHSSFHTMLPARIIRCYRSMYLFTPAMVDTEKRVKAMHGDWEHLFCNHYEQRDWVAEHTPEWLELYNFYPIDRQREQVFRWLAVWKLGGFWLNTQLRPFTSLEPLRGRPLVLAEKRGLSPQEFEALHRMPWDAGMPPESLIRISDMGFAAEAGHWFVQRVLDLLMERAGFLDTNFEPTQEEEAYTTGAGVVNAAWFSCLMDGRPVLEALLPAPRAGSTFRPTPDEPERAEDPEGLGEYGYRHTDLNA